MGSGQSAVADDEAREAWLKRNARLNAMSARRLLELFDDMRDDLAAANPHSMHLTRSEHASLKRLQTTIEMLP